MKLNHYGVWLKTPVSSYKFEKWFRPEELTKEIIEADLQRQNVKICLNGKDIATINMSNNHVKISSLFNDKISSSYQRCAFIDRRGNKDIFFKIKDDLHTIKLHTEAIEEVVSALELIYGD